MGKYKNGFAVSGSTTLLEAFEKELQALKYEDYTSSDVVKSKERLRVYGFNGNVEAQSSYTFYDRSSAYIYEMSQKIYQLPNQWDEALAAASELYVPERVIKAGQWVKWVSEDFYRLISSGNGFRLESWLKKSGYKYLLTDEIYSVDDILQYSDEITEFDELENYLTEVFASFGIQEHYTGVRDVKKGQCGRDGIADNFDDNLAKEGKIGPTFSYNPDTDTLYNYGYGIFVVYEKGVFAKPRKSFPKLHGYTGKIEKAEGSLSRRLVYGCKSFSPSLVIHLDTQLRHFNQNKGGKVTHIIIDNGHTIPIEELQEIVKSLKEQNF